MNLRPFFVVPIVALSVAATAVPILASQQNAVEKVEQASRLFATEMSRAESRIPRAVLRNAVGIAIIPNVVKAGFIVGGTRGDGVLVVRNSRGEWSNPAFLSLTGGSVGFQVGAQSSDVIVVFNTRSSIEKALTQDFEVGGNVSANAGPSSATPVSSTIPDIYTYVRNQEGLFAGVSLQGTKLEIQDKRNRDYYGQPGITPQQIFTNPPTTPASAASLRQVLSQYAPR